VSDKPRTQENPQKWDTSRGQLSYRLDLTKESNLLKWLGSFSFTGYGEYKYRSNRQYSWREAFDSPVSWVPTGTIRDSRVPRPGLPPTSRTLRVSIGITSAPPTAPRSSTPLPVSVTAPINSTGSAAPAPLPTSTYITHTDNIMLGQVAADKSGGTFNSETTLKTAGIVGQSHLLDDRLITTLGWRNDSTWTRFGNPGQPNTNDFLNSDGTTFNPDIINHWNTTIYKNSGHTDNVQFVLHPFVHTPLVTRMEHGDTAAQFFGDLLAGSRSTPTLQTAS